MSMNEEEKSKDTGTGTDSRAGSPTQEIERIKSLLKNLDTAMKELDVLFDKNQPEKQQYKNMQSIAKDYVDLKNTINEKKANLEKLKKANEDDLNPGQRNNKKVLPREIPELEKKKIEYEEAIYTKLVILHENNSNIVDNLYTQCTQVKSAAKAEKPKAAEPEQPQIKGAVIVDGVKYPLIKYQDQYYLYEILTGKGEAKILSNVQSSLLGFGTYTADLAKPETEKKADSESTATAEASETISTDTSQVIDAFITENAQTLNQKCLEYQIDTIKEGLSSLKKSPNLSDDTKSKIKGLEQKLDGLYKENTSWFAALTPKEYDDLASRINSITEVRDDLIEIMESHYKKFGNDFKKAIRSEINEIKKKHESRRNEKALATDLGNQLAKILVDSPLGIRLALPVREGATAEEVANRVRNYSIKDHDLNEQELITYLQNENLKTISVSVTPLANPADDEITSQEDLGKQLLRILQGIQDSRHHPLFQKEFKEAFLKSIKEARSHRTYASPSNLAEKTGVSKKKNTDMVLHRQIGDTEDSNAFKFEFEKNPGKAGLAVIDSEIQELVNAYQSALFNLAGLKDTDTVQALMIEFEETISEKLEYRAAYLESVKDKLPGKDFTEEQRKSYIPKNFSVTIDSQNVLEIDYAKSTATVKRLEDNKRMVQTSSKWLANNQGERQAITDRVYQNFVMLLRVMIRVMAKCNLLKKSFSKEVGQHNTANEMVKNMVGTDKSNDNLVKRNPTSLSHFTGDAKKVADKKPKT